MRAFHAPETARHDPGFYIKRGRVAPHQEKPRRAELLLEGLAQAGLSAEAPPEHGTGPLVLVHTPEHLSFLRDAWALWSAVPDAAEEVVPSARPPRAGPASYPRDVVGRAGWHLGDSSSPLGPHSWTAILRSADCALAAADAVRGGEGAAYALCRPPGHHAAADRAAGHCYLNNAAIAVERLRLDARRVAVLDIDVHAGDGTQALFWERPDVLTVSIHADPLDFYPFCAGHAHERGAGAGYGYNVNLTLPLRSGDEPWLEAVAAGMDRLDLFQPEAVVLALGLDAHERDPFQGLRVSTEGFRRAGRLIARLPQPVVVTQEGGYLSEDLTANLAAFLDGFLSERKDRA